MHKNSGQMSRENVSEFCEKLTMIALTLKQKAANTQQQSAHSTRSGKVASGAVKNLI